MNFQEIKIRGRCTFLTNPKSNKLFTQCERCRNDQRKYRYENKEKEKARHQLYNSLNQREKEKENLRIWSIVQSLKIKKK